MAFIEPMHRNKPNITYFVFLDNENLGIYTEIGFLSGMV